jgi:hypothetical protein
VSDKQVSDDEKDAVPTDLQAFFDLDLSQNGQPGQDLTARISSEVSQNEIPLSDIIGLQPADITPEMLNWYHMYIGSIRVTALHSVSQMFKQRSDASKGEGFILEVALGTLEETLLINKRKVYKDHREKNRALSDKVEELEDRISEDGRKYNERKLELGRDAKLLNQPLYLFILMFVLFGSESALNLESFEALPWATPAIAWGATIIIGLAIGLAAHYHGTVFKQYAYYFGPAEDDTKRGPAWRMVLGGSLALTVSLWFVYYARSAYFASYLGSLSGFGQANQGGSFLWVVGGSLLGNFLVYLTGTLWAYLMHDSDPEFVDLKKGLDDAKKQVGILKQKMEVAWRREVEQLNAKYRKKVEETRRAFKTIMEQRSLGWPLELFRKMQAQDGRVVALLHGYRQALIQKMGAHAKAVKFTAFCDDPYVSTTMLSVGDFQSRAIKLKYLEEA